LKISLDAIDSQILEILKEDHRKPHTEIAAALKISRNTVNNKINNLIENDIIRNHVILLDPNCFFEKTIFIEVKTNPHEPWLADNLQSISACETIDGIIGEYSLILKLRILENFSTVLNKIDSLMAKSTSKKYQIIDVIHIYKENGYIFDNLHSKYDLDSKDRALIEILRNQGKKALKHRQIGQRLKNKAVSISQPAVSKRIKALSENHLIEKFTIIPDYSTLGIKTKFYVRIKVDPASYNTATLDFLSNHPEISALYRTGENYGLLAIVRTKDIENFNIFLQSLYTDTRIIDTQSTLVLEERKNF
jgi:DNA-binding Lrp family transcriptional regulator